ncbi:MAG: CHAT domain-containing tetratricopeptide repeat protein, partial [Ktedonobacteraceae bacterium]
LQLADGLDDPFLKGGITGVLASLHERLGDIAAAASYFQQTLDIAEEAHDETMITPARRHLAKCYHTLGQLDPALVLVERCLEDIQRLGVKEEEISCLLLKGNILQDLGRFDEAEAVYDQANQLAEANDEHNSQFEALTSIGMLLLQRGAVREAIKHFRQTLKLVEGWGNPVMIGSTRNNLGNALLQLSKTLVGSENAKARKALQEEAQGEFSNALFVKVEADDLHGQTVSFIGMGDAQKALGQAEDAKTAYSMALIPIFTQYQRTGQLSDLSLYATRVDSETELTDEALPLLTWGRDVARAQGKSTEELFYTTLLVQHILRQGQEQQAMELCREILQRCAEQEITSLHVLHLQSMLANLLVKHPESYQEAYQLLADSLAALEKNVLRVQLNEHKAEMIAQWIVLYGTLLQLLIEHGDALRLPKGTDAATLAFDIHESAKSRTFLAEMATATLAQPESIPEALCEREAELLTLVRDYQDEYSKRKRPSAAFRFERLRELYGELHACWEEMRPFAQRYVRLRSGEPATLQEIRDLLSAQRTPMALISFFCDDSSTTCFVIRSDDQRLHVFRCPLGRESLQDAVDKVQLEFDGGVQNGIYKLGINARNLWKRNLHFLDEPGQQLFAFTDLLRGIELLCLAPHGPLHLLPLHSMRIADEKPLAEVYAVTYCPSLSTLRYCLDRQSGNMPSFADRPAVYVAGIASRDDAHPEYFEHDDEIFPAQSWNITRDSGIKATSKSHILQHIDTNDVVHLTCHGLFEPKDPLNSGLLVSNGYERPPRYHLDDLSGIELHSYLITARELLHHSMRASLVTLRACVTGRQGERNVGDEFAGLSRALLYAGNAAVIVSLWSVDQQTSLRFMKAFYQYWTEATQAGQPRAKYSAFRQAQIDFLAAQGEELALSHPYHWAPFILIGDWR